MPFLLCLLLVVGTAIWVYTDAKSIGVAKGQLKGLANLSPVGWTVACVGIWIIAFPLYMFKRTELKRINGKAIKSNEKAIAMFAVALSVAAFLTAGVFGTMVAQEASLETSARDVVTNIIQGQLGGTARCVAVDIRRKIAPGLYSAGAVLDNGNELNITIEDRGDAIMVRIAR